MATSLSPFLANAPKRLLSWPRTVVQTLLPRFPHERETIVAILQNRPRPRKTVVVYKENEKRIIEKKRDDEGGSWLNERGSKGD